MKKVLLTLVVALIATASSFGQDTETRYSFCCSYSYKENVVYISNIVSWEFEEYASLTPTGLANKWHNKFNAECNQGDYWEYASESETWNRDKGDIYDRRNRRIANFKNKGLQIIYINDFEYYD